MNFEQEALHFHSAQSSTYYVAGPNYSLLTFSKSTWERQRLTPRLHAQAGQAAGQAGAGTLLLEPLTSSPLDECQLPPGQGQPHRKHEDQG